MPVTSRWRANIQPIDFYPGMGSRTPRSGWQSDYEFGGALFLEEKAEMNESQGQASRLDPTYSQRSHDRSAELSRHLMINAVGWLSFESQHDGG